MAGGVRASRLVEKGDNPFEKQPKDRFFSALVPDWAVFQDSGLSRDCIGRSSSGVQLEDTIDSGNRIYASKAFV